MDGVREFSWPVRVYYEDTDAGGVVYYANYLRYMERARTEWLRRLGLDQSTLARDPGILFAVHRIEIDYLRPARLDARLRVTVRIEEVRRTALGLAQSVLPEDEPQAPCCRGRVRVVCVDAERFRPVPLPAFITRRLHED
ncbi:MAG: tol-pal system-associated acyl-CoA thioesterase [Gammaproteobacteria bacterium]|nr:MAG: tol-pal system-associated acyl-CoA thioesterase [Gammaproteobacteria bacterium]